MIDQLMQMIQQSGQQTVVENSEVPNENNDAILNEAQQSITSGLQGLASTGELNTLMESTNDPQQVAAHPAVQNISNNFMGSIMDKFGISKGTAATIAASIIPMVIGKMMNKGGQQGGGGFDLGGLLSSLTGGNAAPTQQGQPQQQSGGGIMDTLSNLGAKMGLDKDGDGDVDMSDISKMIK